MIMEEIKKNALKLDIIERIHLVETLLESLDRTDEQIEKEWASESEKRYKAFKAGRVKGVPIEQFHARLEK